MLFGCNQGIYVADTSNSFATSFGRKIMLSFASAMLVMAGIPAFAQTTVTNTATVTPPTGVTNPGTSCPAPNFNATTGACSAADTDTVIVPILGLSKASNGPWTIGQTGAQYTLTPNNTAGTAPTSGTITVVDVLPVGITPNFTGPVLTNGWTCNASGRGCVKTSALLAKSQHHSMGAEHETIRR